MERVGNFLATGALHHRLLVNSDLVGIVLERQYAYMTKADRGIASDSSWRSPFPTYYLIVSRLKFTRSSIRDSSQGPINPNAKITRHQIRRKSPGGSLSRSLNHATAFSKPPVTITSTERRIRARTFSFGHKLLKASMLTKGTPTINSPTLCWITPSNGTA